MPVVLRGSAIVAAFMLVALSGCGQNGPLYLPVVPPLPAPLDPPMQTDTPHAGAAKKGADAAAQPAAASAASAASASK